MVTGEVTESQLNAKQVTLFPLGPLPHIQHHNKAMKQCELPHPGEHLRLHPLLRNRRVRTKKKKVAQMKEQIKAPEKIQLSNEDIGNISDTQFKTLIIMMLTELLEHGHKLDEKLRLC